MSAPFTAYQGKESYTFVSYSHKDKDVIYKEIEKLYKEGYKIWYDEGIQPATEWPEEIAIAINNCSTFLVFISPQSIESKNVRNEIHFALNKKKTFIAIYIEDTTLPPGLELQIGLKQAIMKFKTPDEEYYRKLCLAIKQESLSIPENTILKVKEKVIKIVSYKGAQIPQFEADVLQELEDQLAKQFNLVSKLERKPNMGFVVKNQRITEIGIYKCKLTTLPESIGTLRYLQTLDLSWNYLTAFPKSISSLNSLLLLNLNGNKIVIIPESIENLTSIESIGLELNKLDSRSKSVLKQLKRKGVKVTWRF